MHKTILVTGGYGFLGRAVAKKFKAQGYRVVGLGHGHWYAGQSLACGYDVWCEADISLSNLQRLDENYDVVIHCAGNSSVGYSFTNPFQDFNLNVMATVELLEYLRLVKSNAVLIYPSSASVYGAVEDVPIKESMTLNPISPYGYHKKIIEDLLTMYSRLYGMRVSIIRFFSIYGPGVRKQLLWDAAIKLSTKKEDAVFWGTGNETRDWIYIDDAVNLIFSLSCNAASLLIVNGASGMRVTIKFILNKLARALNVDSIIEFNGSTRPGDPRYYHADVLKLDRLGIRSSMPLDDGVNLYADWFGDIWSR